MFAVPDPRPPLRCPFWPTCEAELAPRGQLVRVGSDEIEWVYPIHEVVGDNSWFGSCPASHALITYLPNGDYQLTEYMTRLIEEQGRTWVKWTLERTEKLRAAGVEPPETPYQQIIRKLAVGEAEGPVGGEGRPERPIEESFPGRPADAPEPGPGEEADQPVPEAVDGERLGRGTQMSDDNRRDSLKGLTDLAVRQLDQTREMCDRITNALNEAQELLVAAGYQIDAAQSLVRSAVGDGSGLPPSAEALAEQTHLAASTLRTEDEGDGTVLAAVQLALVRVRDAREQLSAAIEGGREYYNIP